MDIIYKYQDETKTLTDDIENDLIANLPKKYQTFNDGRQSQLDDIKKIKDDVYLKNFSKQLNWKHSFKIPDLFEKKQTLKAHIWENTYQDPEQMFDVEGKNPEADANTLAQKAQLVNAFKDMKVSKELDKMTDDIIDTGDGVLFVGWETIVKQIRRKKTWVEKTKDKLQKMFELLTSDVNVANEKMKNLLAKTDNYVITDSVGSAHPIVYFSSSFTRLFLDIFVISSIDFT